jgi:hypothetical protein
MQVDGAVNQVLWAKCKSISWNANGQEIGKKENVKGTQGRQKTRYLHLKAKHSPVPASYHPRPRCVEIIKLPRLFLALIGKLHPRLESALTKPRVSGIAPIEILRGSDL